MAPHGRCCGDAHQHNDDPEMGIQYSLYTKIDTENLECLNETTEGTGKKVFKPWEERLNYDLFVESDADQELLFNVPFTGNVKLKGIIIMGEDSDTHPSRVRIFKNRPSMTFDDIGATPDQEFQLHIDNNGTIEYPTKVVTFNNVHHLTLHFPSNFGADKTCIYYIGMKGEFMQAHHHGVTICTYESSPNIADHEKILGNITHQVQ